jgi:hypothetical protein
VSLLRSSYTSRIFDECSELANFQLPEGEIVVLSGRHYCWISLDEDGCIYVPRETLGKYGVKLGDRLLLVRGSRFCVSFLCERFVNC